MWFGLKCSTPYPIYLVLSPSLLYCFLKEDMGIKESKGKYRNKQFMFFDQTEQSNYCYTVCMTHMCSDLILIFLHFIYIVNGLQRSKIIVFAVICLQQRQGSTQNPTNGNNNHRPAAALTMMPNQIGSPRPPRNRVRFYSHIVQIKNWTNHYR